MTEPVFVPAEERNSFDADDAMTIHEYVTKNDAEDTSFVLGELDGFHGTFVNHKSEKLYYVLSGSMEIRIEDETYELTDGDTLLIPPETKHAMEGEARMAIVASPPFDPAHEDIIGEGNG